MSEYTSEENSDPSSSSWMDALPSLPRTAGWMLLVNLLLGCAFFLELQWYLEGIYRFSPWIPFLPYERIDTAINVLWGAFMLHLGAPLARGRLEILTHPEKFLGKEAFGLFCHRRTAAVAGLLVAGVYGLIWFSPALHLVHLSAEETPVVVVDGTREQFQGTSVPLLGDDMDVGQTEVVVSGKHRFLRVPLYPDDMETYTLFPTHKHIDLDRVFLRRNLTAVLNDASGKRLASFDFNHQRDQGLSTQCAESDLQSLFTDDPRACVTLLRNIVADMSGNSRARLLRTHEGTADYKGRTYRYSYTFGPELQLSISAPEANSKFANSPGTALEAFWQAGEGERELLVSEFRKDVGSLSPGSLEDVFRELFGADDLGAFLRGSRSRKIDVLLFARDVLALGVDHVESDRVSNLVESILDRDLVTSTDDRVSVPALGAVIALTRVDSVLRSTVLDEVHRFFTTSPHARRNASNPAVAGILLDGLDDRSVFAATEQVVAILNTIRGNAVTAGTDVELIDSQIRERIGELSDGLVVDRLREAMDGRQETAEPDVQASGAQLE